MGEELCSDAIRRPMGGSWEWVQGLNSVATSDVCVFVWWAPFFGIQCPLLGFTSRQRKPLAYLIHFGFSFPYFPWGSSNAMVRKLVVATLTVLPKTNPRRSYLVCDGQLFPVRHNDHLLPLPSEKAKGRRNQTTQRTV